LKAVVIKGAADYLGESFDKKILSVYDPLEPVDFQNTIAHEIGHAFGQVMLPGATSPMGVPDHPNHYDSGQGIHCNYKSDICLMYESGPIKKSLNQYCPVCQAYLVAQDFAKIT
jgi:hypothetical protein